jgi:imidazolonepropionase-like amidohydrolase
MLRNKVLAIAVAVLAALAMTQTAMPQREKIAIVGATLIDVGGYGRSTNDVGDSVVLIDEGKIVAAGPASQIAIPSGRTKC